jgi:hypothetical protein
MIFPFAFLLAIAAQPAPLPHLPLDQALAHLRAGTIDFDLVAMRDDYSAPEDYHAGTWMDRDEAATALDQGRHAEALKMAEAALTDYPLDSDVWAVKAEAEKAAGDQAAFDRDMRIAVELLRAIERTGDGKSAASAWHVISVAEEYELMAVKGYKVGNQALVQQDGHTFDRLEVTDQSSGETSSVWFNIDRVFGHEL